MSKEAAVRAMREARYAAQQARAGAQPATARPPVAPPVERKRPTRAQAETTGATATVPGLCGHRSMNGRTCTREQGHAAKNHRYS